MRAAAREIQRLPVLFYGGRGPFVRAKYEECHTLCQQLLDTTAVTAF